MQSKSDAEIQQTLDAHNQAVDGALAGLAGLPGVTPDEVSAAYADTYAGRTEGILKAWSSLVYGPDGTPETEYLVDGLPLSKWRFRYVINWTAVLVTVVICATVLAALVILILAGVF